MCEPFDSLNNIYLCFIEIDLFKMSYQTRSQSIRSLPETSQSEPFSQAEIETISKNLHEKDKLLREQSEALKERAESLKKRELELEERTTNSSTNQSTPDLSELKTIIASFQQELSTLRILPDQLNSLQQYVYNMQTQTSPSEASPSPPRNFETQPTFAEYRGPEQTFSNQLPTRVEKYPIRLKDVADSIPKFDGHKISIFQFSKMCERALRLIPPDQELFLVQLIIGKLQGHAYTAVDGSEFFTVNTLMRRLKDVFGPNKSLDQYRGELANTYMKYNESIFDYIERIKDLRTAIIDAEIAFQGYMSEIIAEQVDRTVLTSFINGLPSDLLIRVKLEGYETLDDAFMKTIQIKKAMEVEALRQRPSFPNRPSLPPRADTSYLRPKLSPETSNNFTPRSILQRPKQPSEIPFIKPLIPGQPGPNRPSPPVCHYCKLPGHFIADCQKLAYKRSLNENSGPVGRTNDNIPTGNATRVSVNDGVRRDADSSGRQNQTNTVRFSEPDPRPSTSQN